MSDDSLDLLLNNISISNIIGSDVVISKLDSQVLDIILAHTREEKSLVIGVWHSNTSVTG